ncbi:hypothetical protein ACVBIL_02365 [Shewanella sp. 125m-7]
MLAEHFIDPEMMPYFSSSRRNYRDFLREFSKQSPRVVAELEAYKRFRSKALKAQSTMNSELEGTRLIELLEMIKEECLVSRGFTYSSENSVLENFMQAHSEYGAEFFMVRQMPDEIVTGVNYISLESIEDGFVELPRQLLVEKNTPNILRAIDRFLKLSKSITFVEPHFRLRTHMMEPMVAYLSAQVTDTAVTTKTAQILLKHTDSAPTAQVILDRIVQSLGGNALRFNSISVMIIASRIGGEMLHNRYMISELGALDFGIGLDTQEVGVVDDVCLLDTARYKHRYEQYVDIKAFDVVDHAST